ncbi:unnamed protein product [Schistosoma margrebowiei]|uniref:Uncharacterized protein n=1 Tax=Schistosoma margrebowiei TaxID=48269 RepID=A0A183MUA2_9TREM|nr:unnamed protein product [Schistosoma margrebowiei]
MNTLTSKKKPGIQWTALMQLDDLDFTDDLALPSHTYQQVQVKIENVTTASVSVGFKIYKGKSKILNYDIENTNPIMVDSETLEEMGSFTYHGSIANKQRGSDVITNW